MKKVLFIMLSFVLLLTALPVCATTLEVDGAQTDSDMIFTNSTAYVPLSSVAKALNLRISTDAKTNSVFVNGIVLFPEKSDTVGIYVNGKKYTPTDTMAPIMQNGEVYLPAHLAAEAFGKEAKWYTNTATLVFTTPAQEKSVTVIDPNKTYAIINVDTSVALSAGENSLSAEPFSKADNQKFRFVNTEFDGYYHIQSVLTGKNLDVNAHGTTPGVSIITWDKGDGDNQKFTVEDVAGGALISARSCHLPIEPSGSGVIQNARTLSDKQKWQIVEFDTYKEGPSKKAVPLEINYTPPVKEESSDAPFRTFSIGNIYLTDSDGLKGMEKNSSSSQKWTVITHSEGVYVVENPDTKKSLDVNARALTAGASIITWQTSSDTNQRWIFEQNGDGTYYIKSVHSGLYLTLTDDNLLVQQPKDITLKQRWTIAGEN